MAGICPPPHIPFLKSAPAVKHVSRIWMLKPTKLSVKRTLTLQIRSSIKNKVFEDRSKGIICYKDDHGEIICEGYDDEEPRFHQQIEKTPTDRSSDPMRMSRSILFYNKVGLQWLNAEYPTMMLLEGETSE